MKRNFKEVFKKTEAIKRLIILLANSMVLTKINTWIWKRSCIQWFNSQDWTQATDIVYKEVKEQTVRVPKQEVMSSII